MNTTPSKNDPLGLLDSSSQEDMEHVDQDRLLGKDKTKAVCRLRLLFLLVLLGASVVVSVTIFSVSSKGEQRSFQAEFTADATRLTDAFADVIQKRVLALVTFSQSLTDYATDTKSNWPFVTVPNFHERVLGLKEQVSGMLQISYLPVVSDKDFLEWGKYAYENLDWVATGRSHQCSEGFEFVDCRMYDPIQSNYTRSDYGISYTQNDIYVRDENGQLLPDPGPGPYVPVFQTSPVQPSQITGLNILSFQADAKPYSYCLETGNVIISHYDKVPPGGVNSTNLRVDFFARLVSYKNKKTSRYNGEPVSNIVLPIFDQRSSADRKIVGLLSARLMWRDFFRGVLTYATGEITLVIRNKCGGLYSFVINGPDAEFLGYDDFHDGMYNDMEIQSNFASLRGADQVNGFDMDHGWCEYSIHVFPTSDYEEQITTNHPILFTASVAGIFLFTFFMFLLYDRFVESRQKVVSTSAENSTALVSSIFPRNIQRRLLDVTSASEGKSFASEKNRVQSFLVGGINENTLDVKPIADLFPQATVFCANISGFTSWSSTREPGHAFILLETVYQNFDVIAKRYNVFKVETIGDSYIACTGIPEDQPRHALLIAEFAWECHQCFSALCKKLETVLGPETTELGLRIGVHSGPVTAGVLRGERARFQLFGDTVNNARRMERTCLVNRIQVTKTTADLLASEGKSIWLTPRSYTNDRVSVGMSETFWLCPNVGGHGIAGCGDDSLLRTKTGTASTTSIPIQSESSRERICVMAHRELQNDTIDVATELVYRNPKGKTCLEELEAFITLPRTQVHVNENVILATKVDSKVSAQLMEYISEVANTYHDNPFHNLEHAGHVTMAVVKLLKRVIKPDIEIVAEEAVASDLHDHTYGINSDPIAIMAIVMSAIVHDSDHRGVSNAQLAKEFPEMDDLYKRHSLAEQNSLDLCWNMLMEERFAELRVSMFGNRRNMLRFRQVFVNVVLATDIFDQELNDLRKMRWLKAFSAETNLQNTVDFRATIVIEHIIQASDVSHTMQHWNVYKKWNQRLFTEMYLAYKAGRMGKDPSTFWYQGEIIFFDNYVVPLAMKLKDSNVFGASSDECLNYALNNRAEWEQRGETIVEEFLAAIDSVLGKDCA